jgi:cholesterol transport system auxiliary component
VRALAFVLATLASACALTSRGGSVEWRYFTPERVRTTRASADVGTRGEVCLGHVTAGGSLGRRIAYGDGAYQVGFYEDRRWTEEPELYVRRALERTLFQDRALRCDPEATAPKLNVEVLRFEEVKAKAGHTARVALRAVLVTDRVLLDQTFQFVEPVGGSRFDDVVEAIGRALDEGASEVARRTTSALTKATGPSAAQ